MPEETTIYEKGDIKVTNLRAMFGSKTYAVNSISSVEAKSEKQNGCLPGALLIFGALIALFGYSGDNNGTLVIGILLAFFGGVAFYTAKPTHIVQIASASGEVKAYSSANKTDIDPIVEALNKAIIQKG